MKRLLGILFMSLIVLGIFSGLLYLKVEETNTYSQIMGIVNQNTQTANNNIKINNGGLSDKSDEKVIQDKKNDSESKTVKKKKAKKDNTAKVDENKALSSADSNPLDINVPITENVKESIPEEELKAVQKADMLPVEGTGEEIADTSVIVDEGELVENYSFSEQMYPYRTMLNNEEQKAYDQIYANTLNYNSGPFALQASINISQMEDVMTAVYNDHPELFWLETQYEYQYGRDRKVYSIKLKFNETIDDIDSNVAGFNQKVNEIVDLAREYETDVEKERFVHDYLINATTYDESAPMHQSAYSALVNGRSVCAGYSRAFQHIMMQMGVPTYYCTGVADGGAHAWNIIKLGDSFYNVDSLWDDSVGEQYSTECYLYFNVPDSEFNTEHRRTGLSMNLPACTGTDMSYESVFGNSAMGDMLSSYGLTEEEVIDSLEEYYDFCEENITESGVGQSSFTTALTDMELFDEIYDDATQQGYMEGYMSMVAENLGLSDYKISLEFSVNELPDGHMILTQYNSLISR